MRKMSKYQILHFLKWFPMKSIYLASQDENVGTRIKWFLHKMNDLNPVLSRIYQLISTATPASLV